jgi:hypothetical protein
MVSIIEQWLPASVARDTAAARPIQIFNVAPHAAEQNE